MEKKLWISVLLCLGAFVGSIGAALSPIGFQGVFTVDKTALVPQGSNPFMIVKPGYRLVLTDGEDSLTITALPETRWVDGVETRVIEERETEGGKLKEVSRNYMAVDRATGDVYYFGEDVDMLDANGQVMNHEGSWHSGVNGARFGLLMPGQPRVGQRYYQEQAPKVALDRAEIVALDEEVETPYGSFKHCLKTAESSDLERGVEAKWYAPGVGLLRDGDFELTKVEVPVGDTASNSRRKAGADRAHRNQSRDPGWPGRKARRAGHALCRGVHPG